MAGPKKPLPEQVATQIAGTAHPQGGAYPQGSPANPADRRTAALPQSQVPTATPHAQTMMFDPHAGLANGQGGAGHGQAAPGGVRAPMQTVLSTPHAASPQAASPRAASPHAGLHPGQGHGGRLSSEPLPAPSPSGVGRWIAGPILAAIVGVLTLYIAGMVSSGASTAKNRGRLRLSSDPDGATVFVDGKVHPHPTPTVIEGEIGATLRVGFRLDGYLEREADVFVGEGERPFRAKLDRRDPAPVVLPLPVEEPAPPPRWHRR